MSDVPAARQILADLAARLRQLGHADCAETVESAVSLMVRRSHARPRSPNRSRVVDEGLAGRIRVYALEHPAASQQDIAERFGTNHGRVSEALHGDR